MMRFILILILMIGIIGISGAETSKNCKQVYSQSKTKKNKHVTKKKISDKQKNRDNVSKTPTTPKEYKEYIVYSPVATGYKGEYKTYGGYIISTTNDYDSALFIAEEIQYRQGKPVYIIKGDYNILYRAYKESCLRNFIHRSYSDYPKLDSERLKMDLKMAIEYYKDVKIPSNCNINKLEELIDLLDVDGIEGEIKSSLIEYLKFRQGTTGSN